MTVSSSLDPSFSSIPILDIAKASDKKERPLLLQQLHDALFNVGFLYIINHGVPQNIITNLTDRLPTLFDLPLEERGRLSKLNSPHFLGYSGFAEETTLGKQDLREQFDFCTELPVIWQDPHTLNGNTPDEDNCGRDFTKPYWRLRGPNQWPPAELIPGFREALTAYHDAVAELSYHFVHLVEEAFGIPIGTFDHFFQKNRIGEYEGLPPQHRIKLIKYPPNKDGIDGQGVGAHKDSSGWLTFLYQCGQENALEVMNGNGDFVAAPPLEGSFVVNFGNPFEAATAGAVRATVHRVKATTATSPTRYSIPFFQGLPLDLKVSEIQSYVPEDVRKLRERHKVNGNANDNGAVSSFLDPRWDNLGESQLRKWIRSHEDVGRRWYGNKVADYYLKS